MDSRTKCLCCHYWLRTKDPLVGWCQAFGEWRGQFEGYDRELGACQRYVFGEARERSPFTELPKPKRAVSGHWTPIIEQNIERIRAWKAEGRENGKARTQGGADLDKYRALYEQQTKVAG